jgi:hypothetical protein
VIGKNEVANFRDVTEMFQGFLDIQKLPIGVAVFLLR